jgi:hypothetical protein
VFDLEVAVAGWRAGFARDRAFSRFDLDELEDHLRAAYEVELHLNPGLAPAAAFDQARAVLGAPEELSGEYAKVEGTSWRRLVTVGWVMFAVSWFLPVHRGGITLADLDWGEGLLPGIQAFLVAFDYGDSFFGVASALTNLLMAATFWRISDAGRLRATLSTAFLLAGMALNLWWLVEADPATDLLAGYYAWAASFGVVGAGLAARAMDLADRPSRNLIAAP